MRIDEVASLLEAEVLVCSMDSLFEKADLAFAADPA
jgi:hypothetical protein